MEESIVSKKKINIICNIDQKFSCSPLNQNVILHELLGGLTCLVGNLTLEVHLNILFQEVLISIFRHCMSTKNGATKELLRDWSMMQFNTCKMEIIFKKSDN